MADQTELKGKVDPPTGDDFQGDNEHLIDCIHALVDMSDNGLLLPHGLGGHARKLLLSAANRLPLFAPDKAVLGVKGEREAIVRIISEKVRLAPLVEDGIEVGAEIVGMHEAADAILALSERPAAEGWRPTHRHVKRGTVYRVVGQALLQTDSPAGDDAHLLVYQGADGLLWARPSVEFYDGRFEPIAKPLITREWFERKVGLEDGCEIGAGSPALPQDVEGRADDRTDDQPA